MLNSLPEQIDTERLIVRVASWRLAERAGFQLEGILRNERLDLAGEFRNTRIYARIAP